jgi:N-6 DNA Methylase
MPETPEQKARREIDVNLTAAGWLVQNRDEIDLTASRGVAVREFQMKSGFGFADYLLYLDRKALGAVEAKPGGTLTGVEAQSAKYAAGLPTGIWYLPGVKANVIFFDKKEGRAKPWTDKLWVYDLRTNQHFTLKQKPIQRSDFDEFVECYRPGAMHKRKPTWSEGNPDGRWRSYDYQELLKRDKLSLDLFWIRDKSLTDTDSLPAPEIIAAEIADDLEAALALFTKIAARLSGASKSGHVKAADH